MMIVRCSKPRVSSMFWWWGARNSGFEYIMMVWCSKPGVSSISRCVGVGVWPFFNSGVLEPRFRAFQDLLGWGFDILLIEGCSKPRVSSTWWWWGAWTLAFKYFKMGWGGVSTISRLNVVGTLGFNHVLMVRCSKPRVSSDVAPTNKICRHAPLAWL